MRDPNRIPQMLQLLGAAWMANPDMRLTQLVQNAASAGGWTPRSQPCICGKDGWHNQDPFHVEDDTTTAGLVQLAHGDVVPRG
jgi:hypothetical protein